ncbi:MAG: hypothetical protein ACM33B_00855 [Pseudomonadota bacterium]
MYATDPAAELATIMLERRRLLRVVTGTVGATGAVALGALLALLV